MTLVSVNKHEKKSYIWDMNQNVFIHQKDDKKVCDFEKHYELLIIELDIVSMKKTVLIQKKDNPVIKTPHTDQIAASRGEDDVTVQANFEKNHSLSVDFRRQKFKSCLAGLGEQQF
jgi:hypothetical protein